MAPGRGRLAFEDPVVFIGPPLTLCHVVRADMMERVNGSDTSNGLPPDGKTEDIRPYEDDDIENLIALSVVMSVFGLQEEETG